MRVTILILFVPFLCSAAFSATIYVPDHYPKIQDAISASAHGDTIIVRPGIYVENVDFLGKAVVLESEAGPETTVIDGNQTGSVVVFRSGEVHTSVLAGFTLRNGSGMLPFRHGGGVACYGSSPVLTDNVIAGNTTLGAGGGVFCDEFASPVIQGNTITDNFAQSRGGGVVCGNASPVLIGNVISANRSDYHGGGLSCQGGATEIRNNVISGNEAGYDGGGLDCYQSNPPYRIHLSSNILSGNTAMRSGGAINSHAALVDMVNCVISGNFAAESGGGIRCSSRSSLVVSNCTIVSNVVATFGGGGICCWADPTADIVNTIFCANRAPSGAELYIKDGVVRVDYSDIVGGMSSVRVLSGATLITGQGLIEADPLFADAAGGDFHITWLSPCRNTGNSAAAIESDDFEGNPRVVGTVDMGADEYYPHLYYHGEVGPGKAVVFKAIGIPGAGSTLVHGPGLRNPPLQTPYGDLRLQWPLTFHNNGTFPAGGYTEKAYILPTGLFSGQKLHYQLFTGGRLWNVMTLVIE